MNQDNEEWWRREDNTMDDEVVPKAVSIDTSFPSHQSSPLEMYVTDFGEDVPRILE